MSSSDSWFLWLGTWRPCRVVGFTLPSDVEGYCGVVSDGAHYTVRTHEVISDDEYVRRGLMS